MGSQRSAAQVTSRSQRRVSIRAAMISLLIYRAVIPACLRGLINNFAFVRAGGNAEGKQTTLPGPSTSCSHCVATDSNRGFSSSTGANCSSPIDDGVGHSIALVFTATLFAPASSPVPIAASEVCGLVCWAASSFSTRASRRAISSLALESLLLLLLLLLFAWWWQHGEGKIG